MQSDKGQQKVIEPGSYSRPASSRDGMKKSPQRQGKGTLGAKNGTDWEPGKE